MARDWVDKLDWSEWECIASKVDWYEFESDEDFSGVYELALKEDDSDRLKIVYVGESDYVLERLETHAKEESHLAEIISEHLEEGFEIWARYVETDDKDKAVELELEILESFDYDWNIKNN